MFQRIKKAWSKTPPPAAAPRGVSAAPAVGAADTPVCEWAATQGLSFSTGRTGGVAVEGRVEGRRWRLERGQPTREYVVGEELRARAELGLPGEPCVMVINRPLKEALETRAFERSVDQLQTAIDVGMPAEVRWLALFEEFVWEGLPLAFWERYCVVADRREAALAWLDAALAQRLLAWPAAGPSAEVPFTLLLLNGKAYLRMEYRPATLATLQHAALVFTGACEAALRNRVDVAPG